MVNSIERRESIASQIRKQGKVRVDQLSRKFGVSGVTIRNDLAVLEKSRILYRTHGGALIRRNVFRDSNLEQKPFRRYTENGKIAARAVELVSDGDSILLHSGTISFDIAVRLNIREHLTVMTNCTKAGFELASHPGIHLMLAGGLSGSEPYSFSGPEAELSVRNYYFDLFFLEAEGLDFQFGLTNAHPLEARLLNVMTERSQQVIGVMGSGNLARRSFARICGVEALSKLITDKKISQKMEQELQARDIEVIKV